MKLRGMLALLLCVLLCLPLAPAALAAEESIVGFAALGDAAAVSTPYKYSLLELEKLFPAELTVTLDSGRTESTPVTWQCLENYDEDLDTFRFVPLPERPVAAGTALPEITVRVEGSPAHAVMQSVPEGPKHDVPILGILSGDQHSVGWGAQPAFYDGYREGVLPAVRNQNPYGTCWAHAAIGCVEADLIHDGAYGTNIDLAELHTVYFAFHDYEDEKGCNTGDTISLNYTDYLNMGGNAQMVIARLANLVGPAPESAAPYSMNNWYKPEASAGRGDGGTVQLSGAWFLNSADREAVKYNIRTHGGVVVTICAQDACYSAIYNSYYTPAAYQTNHDVMLVGWDDSFPRSNFRAGTPEGDGAWLVRNSWGGSGYSYNSYFWLSYYDKSMSGTMVALDAIPNQYDHCYSYKNTIYNAWYNDMPSGVRTEQSYQVSGGETISAIGVDTETASLALTIELSCGGKTVTQRYNTAYPGYYLIPLQETLPVTKDSAVMVKITHETADGSEILIPFETSSYGGVDHIAGCTSGGMVIVQPDPYWGEWSFNTDADSPVRLFTSNGLDHRYVYGEPDFVLPASLTSMEAGAFEGLSMGVVYVPDTCTSIGAGAFRNCKNLTQIRLPKNCRIESGAFDGCTALTAIFAPAGGTSETWCRSYPGAVYVAE